MAAIFRQTCSDQIMNVYELNLRLWFNISTTSRLNSTTGRNEGATRLPSDSAPSAEDIRDSAVLREHAHLGAPQLRDAALRGPHPRLHLRSARHHGSPSGSSSREGDFCQVEIVYKPGFYRRVPRGPIASAEGFAAQQRPISEETESSSESSLLFCVLSCAWPAVASVLLLFPTAQYTLVVYVASLFI